MINHKTLQSEQSPFLSPADLAERWGIKENSLSQMRYQRRGPIYFQPSRSIVRYPIAEIIKYEQEHMHRHTSEY